MIELKLCLVLSVVLFGFQISPSSQAREKRNEKKSSIDFQGCYSANEFNPVKKFIDNKNLNLKCAKKCRDKAFVLAVTQGSTCGCSNDLPPKQLARPEHSNSSGADSKCNMKCPGAYTRKQCEGDECCGGQNAFTVYTVGEIDVIKEVLIRVVKNLKSKYNPVETNPGLDGVFTSKLTDDGKFDKKKRNIYIVKDDRVWRFNDDLTLEEGFPKGFSKVKVLEKKPNNFDAICAAGDVELTFKGSELTVTSAVTKPTYNKVYKLADVGLPANVDACVAVEKSRTHIDYPFYVIKGKQYWSVPESWPDDPLAGPENLSEMVPGIPDRIDGAFYSEKSDAIYFFRHDLSWKVKSSEVAEGYPKPIMEEWGIELPPSLISVSLIARPAGEGKDGNKECTLTTGSEELIPNCKPSQAKPTLDLVYGSIEREANHGFGKSLKPVGKFDLELDNTKSDQETTMDKEFGIETKSGSSWHVESGFSVSATVGASATAGVEAFGAKAEATISTEISTSLSFSGGYSKTAENTEKESVKISVPVPPYKKCIVNLMKEKYDLEVKWRATFTAKGSVMVSYNGKREEKMITSLLDYQQRKLMAFGTLKFPQREKIIGLVKITDGEGKIVSEREATEDEVKVEKEEKKNKER